ncbi:MlaD family protein [Swingsia samuiensis]|uniref:MCE family protein n=1 Tax=Swingsia samuiensis TaxID=1293412 RepID=A0A4Y6ULZ4_9PROT|nr:MlaD family protein [Swingsia samuiensis]QDH18074.1 MCE family protein [Swingsia samuiensis]
MFRIRRVDSARPLFKNRYADEWVGLLVLGALILFAGALTEAGLLKKWLTPEKKIHFVLPESGVAGLAIGNDIEIMGVHAGEIRNLDLNQEGHMYAEGEIEPQFIPFIRQDSSAVIRHRFVVAGASYIELSRGAGQPLDWGYAVLNATVEPNPADVITKTVIDLRGLLLPAMNNVQQMTKQLNDMLTDMHSGKGTVGGLLYKDTVLQHANQVLENLNDTIAKLKPVENQLNIVMKNANGTVENVRATTASLRKDMPQVHQTLSHVNDATAQLPTLLTQAEASANSLRKLMDQIRGLWILGGSGSAKSSSQRLPAQAVKP